MVLGSMIFWPFKTLVARALAALTVWFFGVEASQGGCGAAGVVLALALVLEAVLDAPFALDPLARMPSLER